MQLSEEEKAALLRWLTPEQQPVDLLSFAQWMDNERNKRSKGLWSDVKIWGKRKMLSRLCFHSWTRLKYSESGKEGDHMSKPIHVKPQFYTYAFLPLKEIALRYGYNLVIHGSMNRDMDLIAIPWAAELGGVADMINEFVEYLGGHILQERDTDRDAFAAKYHGRRNYVINLNRGSKFNKYEDVQYYLDISVTPAV